MPSEDSAQKILDFAVTQAPAGYKITRDPAYGQQYLYCEVNNPTQNSVSVATNFILQRRAISIAIDPDKSKVRVMVNFFGRDTPVELDFLEVEKV